MLGALSLQAAQSEPDTPNAMASLSTAHKMLSQALACKGKLRRQDTAVVCWLLARTELLGNLRRKQEKAEAHVMQVFELTKSLSCVFQHEWSCWGHGVA